MSAYFDIIMDSFRSGNIPYFRKQALTYLDAMSSEERTRVLNLSKSCEDWSKKYLSSLDDKDQINIFTLYFKCLSPEEQKRIVADMKRMAGLSQESERN